MKMVRYVIQRPARAPFLASSCRTRDDGFMLAGTFTESDLDPYNPVVTTVVDFWTPTHRLELQCSEADSV